MLIIAFKARFIPMLLFYVYLISIAQSINQSINAGTEMEQINKIESEIERQRIYFSSCDMMI